MPSETWWGHTVEGEGVESEEFHCHQALQHKKGTQDTGTSPNASGTLVSTCMYIACLVHGIHYDVRASNIDSGGTKNVLEFEA